jgi:VIT1/CCC1 family predicted Fe2+/Mn2+ transporter
MFWGAQILIGSLMIVFTSLFAVGIVSARFKRGGKNG